MLNPGQLAALVRGFEAADKLGTKSVNLGFDVGEAGMVAAATTGFDVIGGSAPADLMILNMGNDGPAAGACALGKQLFAECDTAVVVLCAWDERIAWEEAWREMKLPFGYLEGGNDWGALMFCPKVVMLPPMTLHGFSGLKAP